MDIHTSSYLLDNIYFCQVVIICILLISSHSSSGCYFSLELNSQTIWLSLETKPRESVLMLYRSEIQFKAQGYRGLDAFDSSLIKKSAKTHYYLLNCNITSVKDPLLRACNQ